MKAHKLRREKKYTHKTPEREPEPLNQTLAMLWSARKRLPKK